MRTALLFYHGPSAVVTGFQVPEITLSPLGSSWLPLPWTWGLSAGARVPPLAVRAPPRPAALACMGLGPEERYWGARRPGSRPDREAPAALWSRYQLMENLPNPRCSWSRTLPFFLCYHGLKLLILSNHARARLTEERSGYANGLVKI